MEPCWKLYGRCATFAAITATFAAIAAGRVTLFVALKWVINIRRHRRDFRRNRRESRNLIHNFTVGAQHSPHSPRVMEPCWKLYDGCATFAAIAATFDSIFASRGTLFITLRWVRNIRRIRHGSWNLVGSSMPGAQHSPQLSP